MNTFAPSRYSERNHDLPGASFSPSEYFSLELEKPQHLPDGEDHALLAVIMLVFQQIFGVLHNQQSDQKHHPIRMAVFAIRSQFRKWAEEGGTLPVLVVFF